MRWKYIVISFTALIVIFFTAIYVLLLSYDLNTLKPQISSLVEGATGRQLILGGDIDLKVGLYPKLVIEDIAFRNAEWSSQQNMVQAKRLELQVILLPLILKRIIVKQLIIIEPDIFLEEDNKGKTNYEFEKQSAPAVAYIKEKSEWPMFGSNKIRIENGQFTYKNSRKNETYTGKIEKLTVTGKDIDKPVKLKLAGFFNGESINVEGIIGPLPAFTDPDKKIQLNITVTTGENSFSIDGNVQDIRAIKGAVFDFTANIENPSSIKGFIARPFPFTEPFKFSGKVTAQEPDIYNISDFSFTSKNSAFKGTAEIQFKEKRPKIMAVITAENLDLRPLFPASSINTDQEVKPGKSNGKKQKVFSKDQLPFDNLSDIDVDIQLKSDSLLVPNVAFRNLSTAIHLDAGHLNVDTFKVSIGAGTLDGNFHIQPVNNTWMVETAMKVNQLELNLFVPNKKVTDSLQGKIDALFFLNGRGKSIAEIMANLNGDFGLAMCNGKIATKYIDMLGADFSTSLVEMINPFQKKSDHTEINCFVCILDIENGMTRTKALVLDTGRTRTFGNGYVDLKTEKLNLSLKPVPKEGIGFDKIGKISLSLSELSKPVKISGTLAKPTLSIDLTRTAITLGKVAGGVALLGPAGVALALVTGRIGDDNPCLAALEAVKEGRKDEKSLKYEKKEGIIEKTTNSITDRLSKLLKNGHGS